MNAVLGLIPYIYLGLAVLFAATASDFIICRYDPFVGIFRFNATYGMFIFAAILLVAGIFIARPYCRFLCPYGVLLNWVSRFSWKHLTITPTTCIQCRLCEDSCPYDAIDLPVTGKNPEGKPALLKKLILICLLIPFFIFLGGYTMSRLHETFAQVNGQVSLARTLAEASRTEQAESLEITAFKSSGKPADEVFAEAKIIIHRFYTGSWILGCFLGLAFGLTIVSRLLPVYKTDYTPNKGTCFSCSRCVDYCPVKPTEKPASIS